MTRAEQEAANKAKANVDAAKNETDIIDRAAEGGDSWAGIQPNFRRLQANLEAAQDHIESLTKAAAESK